MKNIKFFKYKDEEKFEDFLSSYDRKLEDVKGFSFAGKKQYRYNVLKLYRITFNDGEYEYFKVAIFSSFNEYHQARLGFSGNKLEDWFQDANVREYKTKGY